MSEPIRVLQVVSTMGQGGIENLLMNIYRNIDKSKVQFDFLVHTNQKFYFDDEIKSLGGNIYHIPRTKYYQLFKTCRNYDRFFREHPEYRIVHSHINTWSTLVLRAAKKANIPVRIAHAHTHITQKKISLIIILKIISAMFINKYVTERFACSQEAAQWVFGKKNKDKTIIFNNAINTNLFQFDSEKRNLYRNELQLNDKTVVIHIGCFDDQKNQLFLIDVFSELYHKNKNTVFLLIGEGKNFEKVKQKVRDLNLDSQVHFLGIRGDVNQLLNAVDAFVFPSLFEGLGIVAIEAQANGLPVIASDVVPKQVVVSDLIRFVSLSQSPEYWANVILEEIQKKHSSRETYSQTVKEHGYDITEMVEWITKFYLQKYNETI